MNHYSLCLAAGLLSVGVSAFAQPAGDSLTSTAPASHPASDVVVSTVPGASSTRADDTVVSTAPTDTAQQQAIAQAFEQRFPGIRVDAVRVTPMGGLYEVQVGMDLLYTDAKVDYVLQGSLIDAKARRDLTAEHLEVLQRVAFDSLPLDQAIRQVKGTGARKVAVFEDPNCGYCKQLHKTLEGIDNTTVYTFLFPILAADSSTKARDIWCAANPAQAWKDWMLKGELPPKAECATPLEKNLELGRKLNVQGTPALFFADGSRVSGALPLDALKKKFDEQHG
ncbi:DsbC family protein [Castellaniella caeni]|uniref:DsbC family protein n=1 Tax=Castellaniella caeni TaxID=266123 RepID=UPI000833CEF3|nr:DsbC family protein [Castellaniella caeni]